MYDWFNPNGESGYAKTEDHRLLGGHATTLGARLMSATGAQPFVM